MRGVRKTVLVFQDHAAGKRCRNVFKSSMTSGGRPGGQGSDEPMMSKLNATNGPAPVGREPPKPQAYGQSEQEEGPRAALGTGRRIATVATAEQRRERVQDAIDQSKAVTVKAPSPMGNNCSACFGAGRRRGTIAEEV